MDGHRPAFNTAFEELNLPFHWDEELYNTLLAIPGGLRRLKVHAEDRGVMLSQDQLDQVRDRKRLHYLERVRQGHVKLRPGVRRLLKELNRAGVQQWIVTSSGSASVMALLEQIQNDIPHFDGVVTSDDVSAGKPAPDGYLLALRRSGADGAGGGTSGAPVSVSNFGAGSTSGAWTNCGGSRRATGGTSRRS